VDDDLVMWVGRNLVPGSGPQGPRDEALLQKCSKIFQTDSGFCPECGSKLIFRPELPELGSCGCGRKHHGSDLTNVFCPTCGAPVSIDEATKVEYRRQKEIEKLFSAIPALQLRGYLLQG
jgi:DNA-directed RNA polymerase subunit RPC12/RpoP